jgi:GNAT superfamily N-acetyltransferase
VIELVEKTPEDLATWLGPMFAHYVEERIRAGEDRETAATQSDKQSAQLFPDGAPAEGQHVMTVLDDGEPVGSLWMGRPLGGMKDTWFVFFVEVDEARRGKGLGRATMLAAERWTLDHGGTRIALNVFGTNAVARSLYESLGFDTMAISMYKDL